MSESLNWLDHLVLALVPLGILTVITGAIRVSGPQVAKSFIGRARENRALAEIELMSSTSNEVCELFNGRGIVRAMGRPKIAEFLIFPKEYNDLVKKYEDSDKTWLDAKVPRSVDTSCGIHSLDTAKYAKGGDGRQPLMEYGGELETPHDPAHPARSSANAANINCVTRLSQSQLSSCEEVVGPFDTSS